MLNLTKEKIKLKNIVERILNITETYYSEYIDNNNINNTIAKKFTEYERSSACTKRGRYCVL